MYRRGSCVRKIDIVVIIGIILLIASSALAGQKEVMKTLEKLRIAGVDGDKLDDLLVIIPNLYSGPVQNQNSLDIIKPELLKFGD